MSAFKQRILEWVTISSLRDFPDPGMEPKSLHCTQVLPLSREETLSSYRKGIILSLIYQFSGNELLLNYSPKVAILFMNFKDFACSVWKLLIIWVSWESEAGGTHCRFAPVSAEAAMVLCKEWQEPLILTHPHHVAPDRGWSQQSHGPRAGCRWDGGGGWGGVSEEGWVSERGNTSMEEKCRCLQVPCWSLIWRIKPSQSLLKGRIFLKEIIFIPQAWAWNLKLRNMTEFKPYLKSVWAELKKTTNQGSPENVFG